MHICKINIARHFYRNKTRIIYWNSRFFSSKNQSISSIKHNDTTSIGYKNNKIINPVSNIRNIGIMAHVDAGKTTLSESFLFSADEISSMGNVDDGTTQLDFMPLEQERGITIRSACSSFRWKSTLINLIDTPGHSDFSLDVYRAMEVIDGCVLVIDGSRNVEAQTIQIYSKLPKGLPLIIFVNKMDREGVTLDLNVKNIKQRLKCNPVALVSISNCEKITDLLSIDQSLAILDPGIKRDIDNLKNSLIELDDELANLYISNSKLEETDILYALRRQVRSGKIIPVFGGSAIKNFGTSILLDYICLLFPSPNESKYAGPCNILPTDCGTLKNISSTAAYIFKIVIDKEQRLNCFIRVCYGALRIHDRLKNSKTNGITKIESIFKVKGNKHIKIDELIAGDIGIIYSNNDDFRAGHYLLRGADINSLLDSDKFVSYGLASGQTPSICFATLECPRGVSEQFMLNSVKLLSIEDPSISISYNQNEEDSLTIGALGELQLEIFIERLSREYGIKTRLGPIRISYRERVAEHIIYTYECDEISMNLSLSPLEMPNITDFSELNREDASRRFSLSPFWDSSYRSHIAIILSSDTGGFKRNDGFKLDDIVLKGLIDTAHNALSNGPLVGGPIVSTKLIISDLSASSPIPLLKKHINLAIKSALDPSKMELLEPVMRMDVNVQAEYLGSLMSHLTTNVGADIWQVNQHPFDEQSVDIVACAKLSRLHGISGKIKSLGRGYTLFTMFPIGYSVTSKTVTSKTGG